MQEQTISEVIKQHEDSGHYVFVNGVKTFVSDVGAGEPVLCLHGVPTSSFLYRKIIKELAANGMRGVSIDLPGLGLSDRPENFDYSFPGFAAFLAHATEVLGLERYHLVVHDIGGPIGFALAAAHPERILSLTILNTWIDVTAFRKPLPMRPFEKPVLGEAQLSILTHTTWLLGFAAFAVGCSTDIPTPEVEAYIDLLKREDGGKAFLKIMRNFEKSTAFRDFCYRAVQNVPYPVQAIWGAEDPGLTLERYGQEIKRAANLEKIHQLRSKHLMQEDKWQEIADLIVTQANSSRF